MNEQPNNEDLLQKKVLGNFTQYDINTLKSTIAAGLNNAEFGLFLNTCVATGLNPFLKQVIPIVYESSKNGRRFDIQVPVEGIEHLARLKEGWKGYDLQLICENDIFKARRDKESNTWIIEDHEVSFPRGKTIGAYCIVPRESFKDVVIFMEITEVAHLLAEYPASKMWGKWFNDMFKKHVKKRGLREQFGIEIDDMSDLTKGPEQYDNTIPSYQLQGRQDIKQEPQDEEFDEEAALQELWDKIADIMEKYEISEAEAEEISKQKLYAPPGELKPQQVAAFAKYLEIKGVSKKAAEPAITARALETIEAEFENMSHKGISPTDEEIDELKAAKTAQIKTIQPAPRGQRQEQGKAEEEPKQKPKSELDDFMNELDLMFDKEGQGELI